MNDKDWDFTNLADFLNEGADDAYFDGEDLISHDIEVLPIEEWEKVQNTDQ